jgi:uncharacterized tellurite resistance protein B-like protein
MKEQGMLDRLLQALRGNEAPASANVAQLWRKQIAVAAMLVEASQVDRKVTDGEQQAIVRAIMRCLGMSEADALRLVAAAQAQFADSLDDWVYADAVRAGYDYEERIEIIGMIWDVVYADGALSKLEIDLLKRLAAHLEIAEEDVNAVRIEAFGRVSSERSGGERLD